MARHGWDDKPLQCHFKAQEAGRAPLSSLPCSATPTTTPGFASFLKSAPPACAVAALDLGRNSRPPDLVRARSKIRI
jgi:hypothetical protein